MTEMLDAVERHRCAEAALLHAKSAQNAALGSRQTGFGLGVMIIGQLRSGDAMGRRMNDDLELTH